MAGRTRRGATLIVSTVALVATVLAPAATAASHPFEPETTAIVQGLRGWARAFGGVAELPEVAEPLPLTDVAIRDALELDRVLSLNLEAALLGADQRLDTLAAIIDTAEGFSNASVTGTPPGIVEIAFDVDLARTVPLRLSYNDDRLRLRGGGVDGGLSASFSAHFEFEFDATETVPQLRFVQVNEPQVTMTAATPSAAANVAAAPATDGFVDVLVGGDYAVDWSLTARMRDPNGRGRLAQEDLEFTAPGDLFRIDIAPDPDSVDIDLAIVSDLVPNPAPHGTIGLGPAAPGEIFAPVVITRTPDYDLLTGVDPPTGFGAFSQSVSALLGAQDTYAADLPLLDGSLLDIYSPASELTGVLEDMARAEFSCGATNSTPPRGIPAPGGDWYCQAQIDGSAGDVLWSTTVGTVDPATATIGATIGESPTANVRITGADAVPRLTVTYTDDAGLVQTARSIAESAQHLSSMLAGAGFGGGLSFDPAAAVLQFDLTHAVPAETRAMAPGGAQSLGTAIGLRGLRADSSAGDPMVDVAIGERRLTAGFGIALDPGDGPNTFLTAPGGRLITVDSIGSTLPPGATLGLKGRIGFLGVDVTVTELQLGTLAPDPAVAVDVDVTTRSFGPHAPVAEAVATDDMVADAGAIDSTLVTEGEAAVVAPPQGTIAIDMTASLDVTAEPLPDGTPVLGGASASADVVWPDLSPGTLAEAMPTPEYQALRLFDLVPTVAGAVETGDATELVDPTADFFATFGIDPGAADRTVARMLINIDDNATCSSFEVVAATTLRCDAPLAGTGDAPTWDLNDRYFVEGDPFALRRLLLDAAVSELGVLDSLDGPHTATFPLLDISPPELAPERQMLLDLIAGMIDAPTEETATLQGMTAFLGGAPDAGGAFALTDRAGVPHLEATITGTSADTLPAPLLVRQAGVTFTTSEPVRTTVIVDTASTTTLGTAIDLMDGSAIALTGTGTSSSATGSAGFAAALPGAEAQLGAAVVSVGADAAELFVGFDVAADTSIAADVALSDLEASLVTTRSGTPNDCTGPDPDPLVGDVCARIRLLDPAGTDIAVLRFSAPATQTGPGVGGAALAAAAAAQPLAVRFTADALTFFADDLEVALDGNSAEALAVLVGPALDGGADVPGAVRAYTADLRPRLRTIPIDPAAPYESLQAAVAAALAASADATDLGYPAPPTVAMICGAAACVAGDTVGDVTDLAVTTTLTADAAGAHFVPFSTGLNGLPLQSSTAIPTQVAPWSIPLTFGVRKGTGPYVGFAAADVTAVDVTAALPAEGTPLPDITDLGGPREPHDCHDLVQPEFTNAGVTRDTTRCLDVVIGVFPGTLTDWTKPQAGSSTGATGSQVELATRLTPAAGEHDLGSLAAEGLPIATSLTGLGQLSVQFETWGRDASFYDVGGTIDIQWNRADDAAPAGGFADPSYQNLVLDKGTWDAMLQPLFEETNEWLAPIRPVIDFVRRPIPVVSDLSRMVGGPNITLLTLMVVFGTAQAARSLYKNRNNKDKEASFDKGVLLATLFIEMVGQFSDFVADTQDGEPPGEELWSLETGDPYDPTAPLISLGGFELDQDQVFLIISCSEKRSGSSSKCRVPTNQFDDDTKKEDDESPKPKNKKAGKGVSKKARTSVGLSIPAIGFPVLDDSTETYNLLLGEANSTLFRADFGYITLGLNAKLIFGPFTPIPADVVVGVSGSIRGRFSMGFDTRAIALATDALNDPGDPYELVDAMNAIGPGGVAESGFYLDDLDGEGEDIPELTMVASVFAGGGLSVKIVRLGIEGGVEVTITLDANDLDGDGRIRIEEFALIGGRTECAFNTRGVLVFFLEFVIEIDLGFFGNIEKRYRLLESPQIELFETNCEPVTPVLAVERDEDGDGDIDLVLTIGNPTLRQAYFDRSQERYVVRQLSEGGATVDLSVEAFGLEHFFTIDAGGKVFGDAGGGADVIRLDPGEEFLTAADGSQQLRTIPFTVPAELTGGNGNDEIVTGEGDDIVDGGNDADVIQTYGGDDIVDGGSARDRIDTSSGDDIIRAGPGDDSVDGGPGVDFMWGQGGDDRMRGGPGYDPLALFPTNQRATIEALLDGGDLISGGPGSDDLDGNFGSDIVDGGDIPLSASTTPKVATAITVEALLNGEIQSITVDRFDVQPPTGAEIEVSCASGPLATSGGSEDADVITGGPDRDYMFGGDGHDLIDGGGGGDVMCGRNGDDILIGDGGAADAGPDEMRGGIGRDRIFGEGGDDQIQGDHNADMIRGGDGDDDIDGGPDADLLMGEGGNDTINGEGTSEIVDPALVIPDVISSGDDRVIECAATTLIVNGKFDVDDDLTDDVGDTGFVEGLRVDAGFMLDPGLQDPVVLRLFTGVIGDLPVDAGRVDFNGDGVFDIADTKLVNLARMKSTSANGDCILAGDGDDVVTGGLGGDHIEGGPGADQLLGNDGKDFVRGNDGADAVIGGDDDDFLVGDDGPDRVEGNRGDDRLRGGEGDDLLLGGSQFDTEDGEDALFGGRGNDVLAAENAVLREWEADDPPTAIPGVYLELIDQHVAGFPAIERVPGDPGDPWYDELFGGFGDDWLFGQDGNDLVRGGHDQDYVEGNAGNDVVHGDDGADVVIGGGSAIDGVITPDRVGDGLADGADLIFGDNGADGLDHADVIAGDNARIHRDIAVSLVPGLPPMFEFDNHIELFDIETTASSPQAGTGAGDTIFAGGDADIAFGQQGDDLIMGEDGDDTLEGNAGADALLGGDDDDILIGGGSANDGLVDDNRDGTGLIDDADDLSGGTGSDLLVGDNFTTTEIPVTVQPLDEKEDKDLPLFSAPLPADLSGAGPLVTASFALPSDELSGGADDDILAADTLWVLRPVVTVGVPVVDPWDDDELEPPKKREAVVRHEVFGGNDMSNGDGGNDVLYGDHAMLLSAPIIFSKKEGEAKEWIGIFSEGKYKTTKLLDPFLYEVATHLAIEHTGVAPTSDGKDFAFPVVSRVPGDDMIGGDGGDDALMGDHGLLMAPVYPWDKDLEAPTALPHLGAVPFTDAFKGGKRDVIYFPPKEDKKLPIGVDTITGDLGDDLLFGQYAEDLLDEGPEDNKVEKDKGDKDIILRPEPPISTRLDPAPLGHSDLLTGLRRR